MATQLSSQDYERVVIRRKLENGSYGRVVVGTVTNSDGTTTDIAIKYQRLNEVVVNSTDQKRTEFSQKVSKEHRLNHHPIVEMAALTRLTGYDHIVQIHHITTTPTEFVMYMDLLDTDCFDLISALSQSERIGVLPKLIVHSLRALSVLELNGIVHGDVKLENIMYHQDKFTLIDFGSAIDTISLNYPSVLPTPQIQSPELLVGVEQTMRLGKGDVWSLGLSILEFIMECYILNQHTKTQQLVESLIKISKLDMTIGEFRQGLIDNTIHCYLPIEQYLNIYGIVLDFTNPETRLLLDMIQINPRDRPTATQLLTSLGLHIDLPIISHSYQPRLFTARIYDLFMNSCEKIHVYTLVLSFDIIGRAYLAEVSSKLVQAAYVLACCILRNTIPNYGYLVPEQKQLLEQLNYRIYTPEIRQVVTRISQRQLTIEHVLAQPYTLFQSPCRNWFV
jgi:serine/threonine protein kinase